MKTTAYRGLDKLDPNFKTKVEKFLNEVNQKEKVIFVTETWRSQERQNELLKAGLSQVKHSNHQDGLAIDIWFYGSELYPADFKKWRSVADIAKKYGINWGYDLWKWDKPHFQDNGKPILNVNFSKMSKYTEIMQNALKDANFEPIFWSHEGNQPLTEQEVKELMEVYGARLYQRIKKDITEEIKKDLKSNIKITWE